MVTISTYSLKHLNFIMSKKIEMFHSSVKGLVSVVTKISIPGWRAMVAENRTVDGHIIIQYP